MKKFILAVSTLFALHANGQVKIGSNPSSINSNAHLDIESNMGSRFIVTKDSSKVGIGTLTPTAKLDVAGKVKITDGTQGNGKLFVSDASGVGSWTAPSSVVSGLISEPWYSTATNSGATLNTENVYQMANVGIKTNTPGSTLSVNGSLGTNYNTITGNYTILNDDYYISYEGTVNANISLPIGASGTCKCEGRTYVLTNPSNYILTLKPSSGEKVSGSDSLTIEPNQTLTIVNRNVTSGNTWKIFSFVSSNKPAKTFQIYFSDANGKINNPETITTSYFNLNASELILEVPTGYTNNKVILNWDVWGDVQTSTGASGSLRFQIERTLNGGTPTIIPSIMMTSWATPAANVMRFSAPASIVLENITPGSYTFRLQCIREGELGSFTSVPRIFGIAAKGDVLVK